MREDINAKLRKLEPVIGKRKALRLRRAYLMEDDFKPRSEIEAHIDLMIARHINHDLTETVALPPPDASLCRGEIEIGEVEYIDRRLFEFSLSLRDLNRHAGIFGSTGSGKTTLALNLLAQLHKRSIPFLVFDWEASYRTLAKELPGVEVYTLGRDDLNPLFLNILTVPEGISEEEYAKSLISLFASDYLSGHGSDSMLLKYLMQTYQEYEQPTFEVFKQIVLKDLNRDMRGRQMLWKQTVGRIIEFLSYGSIAKVIGTNKHFPADKLFNRQIILEFGNLKSPSDRKFLIHLILNWLSLHLSHRGIEHEQLKQMLLFEEFHNITLKEKEDNLVSNLFRESRKYGLGLVAIDQTPSEIPNSVFANMNTKVSFSLSTAQDVSAISKAMNMPPETRHFLGRLQTGQAIIDIKQNPGDPFIIRTKHTERSAFCPDSELIQRIQRDSADSHLVLTPNPKTSLSQGSRNGCISPPSISSPASGVANDIALEPLQKVLIQDIQHHLFDGIQARCDRLGFHPGKMKELSDALIRGGILRPVMIDNLKLLELTDSGRQRAEEAGIVFKKERTRPGKGKGRGGLEHAYVMRAVRDALIESGREQTRTEVKDIDIVAEPEFAIEVETGKAQPYRNIAKLLKSTCENKVMVATKRETEHMLKRVTSTMPDIQVFHFKDFIKSLKKAERS